MWRDLRYHPNERHMRAVRECPNGQCCRGTTTSFWNSRTRKSECSEVKLLRALPKAPSFAGEFTDDTEFSETTAVIGSEPVCKKAAYPV